MTLRFKKKSRRRQHNEQASIVFTPENDASIPFCVDYHKLNALEAHNSYPLYRMGKYVN